MTGAALLGCYGLRPAQPSSARKQTPGGSDLLRRSDGMWVRFKSALTPAVSWTHQACIDLFGGGDLVPFKFDELLTSYRGGQVDRACIPVTTSVVGVTPYLDAVLDLPCVTIVAEYPKMLGYSLLVRPGAQREGIKEVFAHPVAFEEVKPWADRELAGVRRTNAVSGGEAAKTVASSEKRDKASFGPLVGAKVYGLESLVNGIEEGPHNVTRWWVLGRTHLEPTGHDKTSLVVDVSDDAFGGLLSKFTIAGVQILTIYERPSKKTLDTHRYLIEVAGHAKETNLSGLLTSAPALRVLGSYPRK